MSSYPGEQTTGAGPSNRRTISADGTEIAFDLYSSTGKTGVVVIPGFWRTRRYPALQAIASSIARGLAPCAVLDLRGHGDSGGTFEFNRLEHLDVAAVTRSFTEESALEQVVLLGFSAGGAIAISTAARNRGLRIAGLLLVSPVADFRCVIPRPNPFTIHHHMSIGQAFARPRFRWPGEKRLPPLDDVATLALPICLIHAHHDWLVSHRHAESIARRASNAELHILNVPGRYHADRLFDVAGEQLWPIVGEFVRRLAAR